MAEFIKRVKVENYKSIAKCNVGLRSFTLLVGPNGSGKSNFLDALRFVSESLRTTVEHALRDRGGIQEVRRRSRGHPRNFGISLEVSLSGGGTGTYAFRVGPRTDGGFLVLREECRVRSHYFLVEEGTLRKSTGTMREKIEPDRLYLTFASTFPEYRPLYDGLSRMGFYNLNPESLKSLQDPDPGDLLLRDGRNAASVIRRLQDADQKSFNRVVEYVRAIIPGIEGVEFKPLGPKETFEFRQKVAGDDHPWRFPASSMSDGTLRVLGVLLSLFQAHANGRAGIPFIGIEEPEMALHPGASGKLMDALLEAGQQTQVVVTTHSPDLLDHPGINADDVLALDLRQGETVLSTVDRASRDAIRDRLYTVGELLRMGQVEPDEKAFSDATRTLDLFPGESS